MAWLWVFIGGGLGSLVRFGIAQWMFNSNHQYPWATFLANMASSLILGFLFGLAVKNYIDKSMQVFLMAGFCGGFSTFSTFTLENFRLLENGQYGTLILYALSSVLVCLIFLFIGYQLSKSV